MLPLFVWSYLNRIRRILKAKKTIGFMAEIRNHNCQDFIAHLNLADFALGFALISSTEGLIGSDKISL